MSSLDEAKQKLTDITTILVTSLVDDDRGVQVVTNAVATLVLFEVRCSSDDFGKLVGRFGANAKMLRAFVRAAGRKYKLDAYVKLISPTGVEWRAPEEPSDERALSVLSPKVVVKRGPTS